MANLLHANAAISCPHGSAARLTVDADPRGSEWSDRRGSFRPVGDHRMPVHGRTADHSRA